MLASMMRGRVCRHFCKYPYYQQIATHLGIHIPQINH